MNLDALARTDRILDELGGRSTCAAASDDEVLAALAAWVDQIDDLPVAGRGRRRTARGRRLRRILGGGAVVLATVSGTSVAAALSGADVPGLSAFGRVVVQLVPGDELVAHSGADEAGKRPMAPADEGLPPVADGSEPGPLQGWSDVPDHQFAVETHGRSVTTGEADLPVEARAAAVTGTVSSALAPSEPADPDRTTDGDGTAEAAPEPPVVAPQPEVAAPGQSATPPGQAATPPGQAATPPGQSATPPGQASTPPGQASTPPGQASTPPGQASTPPGQASTPPGQASTPPGQAGPQVWSKTPPGQEKTPPGQAATPPGQAATPPGQEKTPPGQAKKDVPPGQAQQPAAPEIPTP